MDMTNTLERPDDAGDQGNPLASSSPVAATLGTISTREARTERLPRSEAEDLLHTDLEAFGMIRITPHLRPKGNT